MLVQAEPYLFKMDDGLIQGFLGTDCLSEAYNCVQVLVSMMRSSIDHLSLIFLHK